MEAQDYRYMAFMQADFDLDGAIFIDDMLQYFYESSGLLRVPIIPDEIREIFREVANYVFTRDIGNAVWFRLHAIPRNYALILAEAARMFQISVPIPGAHLGNFLRLHRIANLTDEDFRRDNREWCANLIDYLAIISNVCFQLEVIGSIVTILDVLTAAADILRQKMEEQTAQKMETLEEFSRRFLTEPQFMVVYIITMR